MAAPSQAPAGLEYEQSFLRILNNSAKHERPPLTAPRQHGFVVLVRGAAGSSLKPLQDLCVDNNRQSYNICFTARYRLQPKDAAGTLLASWLGDLMRVAKDRRGDLRVSGAQEMFSGGGSNAQPDMPTPTDDPWDHISSPLRSAASQFSEHTEGLLTQDVLEKLFKNLSGETSLRVGERLVLFCELSEDATDKTEWEYVTETLFQHLPERVGIVVSSAPKEFHLPSDDPHYLELTVPDDYAAAVPGSLAYKYIDSSFHSDVPAAKDELGVNSYANAIARFVLHPQTRPPIAIGIHGKWGKGKSSFMNLIDSALVKYAEANRAGNTQRWNDITAKLLQAESIQAALGNAKLDKAERERRTLEYETLRDEERALWQEMSHAAHRNVRRLWFNAWQFEDAKQTWAGLASEVSNGLEELLPRRSRLWLKLKYAWCHRRPEIVLNVIVPILVFILIAVAFSFGAFRGIAAEDKSAMGAILKYVLPAGSMIFSLWYVGSQFVKVAQPIGERMKSYIALPNYREQMGFQNQVKKDLQFVYGFVANRLNTSSFNRGGDFRVVVYIDDLDRCSESKIMELLQAVNLILSQLEFFVFVGMDTEMIYRAINSYYKEKTPDRLADDYLSKIIQISFHLPPTQKQTRAAYVNTLFSLSSRLEFASRLSTNGATAAAPADAPPSAPTLSGVLPFDIGQLLKIVPVQIKETEDTPDELQAFTDYSDFIDDNPREIKRLINIHRLIKILVQKPNTTQDMARQKKLVKWLIFCDVWPHLVGEILALKNHSDNCLLALVNSLEEETKAPQSTDEVPRFDGLKEFAQFVPSQHLDKETMSAQETAALDTQIKDEQRIYTLSSADIDEEFRQAAELSLMIRKPVHRPHVRVTRQKKSGRPAPVS